MTEFNFPEGVEFIGEDGNGETQFKVSIPPDKEGFFGRECPSCEQHFRIALEDHRALPDDPILWCVYCGHHDEQSHFMTQQQIARILRAVNDYAVQRTAKDLEEGFRRASRRSRDSLVQTSFRSKPFYPTPLPEIDEKRLVRQRTCTDCGLRYAVFGEHRFCPTCGRLPALATALDALSAEMARLDALLEIPVDRRAQLSESGVLDITYVDTIENVVGIVEALAERIFFNIVAGAERLVKEKGKIFQRLNDLADLFADHAGVHARSSLGAQWAELEASWAARHIFTHCDGIVDSKYLASVPDSPLREGQRVRVTEELARSTIGSAENLCRTLASGASTS